MTEYNGWKNYETWNAALWLDNDGRGEFWQERAIELVKDAISSDEENPREAAEQPLADELEAECDEMYEQVSGVSGMFADILNAGLRAIDWRDIAEHCLSDVEIYSAGWNMPGYMPDNPPSLFTSADDARGYIADQIAAVAEECPEPEYLTDAADACREGKGEFGETIGAYHYFVSKV